MNQKERFSYTASVLLISLSLIALILAVLLFTSCQDPRIEQEMRVSNELKKQELELKEKELSRVPYLPNPKQADVFIFQLYDKNNHATGAWKDTAFSTWIDISKSNEVHISFSSPDSAWYNVFVVQGINNENKLYCRGFVSKTMVDSITDRHTRSHVSVLRREDFTSPYLRLMFAPYPNMDKYQKTVLVQDLQMKVSLR